MIEKEHYKIGISDKQIKKIWKEIVKKKILKYQDQNIQDKMVIFQKF